MMHPPVGNEHSQNLQGQPALLRTTGMVPDMTAAE